MISSGNLCQIPKKCPFRVSQKPGSQALTGEARVNAHAIFIAEPEVAEEMTQCMPAGHAHLVMDTAGRVGEWDEWRDVK